MSAEIIFTDNPVLDAERYSSRKDVRPYLGDCPVCGSEIHGGCDGWDPDEAYEVEKHIYVCSDCLRDYFYNSKVK